jgi:hypothetical protein
MLNAWRVTPPSVSVGIPAYNAGQTLWFALESLCRQSVRCVVWELIICEEQNSSMFGEDNVREYESGLEKAGCVRLEYLPLSTWVPLSLKWAAILERVHPAASVFVVQAADQWSQSCRLRRAWNRLEMESGMWLQATGAHLYDVRNGDVYEYDFYRGRGRVGASVAFSMVMYDAMRAVGERFPPTIRGVDHCLFRSLRPELVVNMDAAPDVFLHGVGHLTDDERLKHRGAERIKSGGFVALAELTGSEGAAKRINATEWGTTVPIPEIAFFQVHDYDNAHNGRYCWIESATDPECPAVRFANGGLEHIPLHNLTEARA